MGKGAETPECNSPIPNYFKSQVDNKKVNKCMFNFEKNLQYLLDIWLNSKFESQICSFVLSSFEEKKSENIQDFFFDQTLVYILLQKVET